MTKDAYKHLWGIGISLGLVTVGNFQSHATEVIVAKAPSPAKFFETFDIAPLTSGLPLVGLRLDTDSELSNDQALASADVYFALPSSDGKEFCVRASTQDARYSALNPYTVPPHLKKESFARLDTLSRRYDDALAEYRKRNLAIKAYMPMSTGCNPVEAVHIPEVPVNLYDGSHRLLLETKVNSRGRSVKASLNRGVDGTIAPVSDISVLCNADRSLGSLSYDKICRIPISDLDISGHNQWFLVLALDDGFSETRYEFALHLPGFE